MNRVILLTDRFLRGDRTGLDRYCDEIAYHLPRLAPQVTFTLVSLGEPSTPRTWFTANIRHDGRPISRRNYTLAALVGARPLRRLFSNADIIHALLPLPVRTATPILTTVHDLTTLIFPDLYPRYNQQVTQRTMRQLRATGSHFCAVSDSTARDLQKLAGIAPDRISRVYPGLDEGFRPNPDRLDAIRERYGLPEQYFLYIGSMHPRKNLSTLLKAYRQLKAQHPSPVKLVLVGRMDLGGDHLTQTIAEQQMEGEIILPGYVDEGDLPTVISGAVALMYPSLYEGFGFPVLEGMACGVPVITAQTSSLPEVAGDAALLCDPHDAAGMARAMHQVSTEADLREGLIRRGAGQIRHFSWEKTARATLDLYTKVSNVRLHE